MDRINNTLLQYVSSGKALNNLRTLAMAILVIIIGWQLARLTLLLLPKTTNHGNWQAPPSTVAATAERSSADVQLIKRANLFGKAAEEKVAPEVKVTNAPVTRLKLKLAGVVASSDPRTAAAIIESSGSQATYGIDDKIDGTQAILKQVEIDRVVISNRGIMETLMLDDGNKRALTQRSPRTPKQSNRPLKKRSAPESKENVAKMLETAGLKRDASEEELMAKLTDFIRVSPKREDNELVGFRVNPGKNRKLFDAIGLKPNDLAVALNGIDLTDMLQATQAVRDLTQQSEVMITVKRGEELHEFLLELPSE